MATTIALRQRHSGLGKKGFYGFSWTTLFFGFFPALFRSDFLTFIGGFVISAIIAAMTFGIGLLFINFVWAFMYNKYFTKRLIEQGYELADGHGENQRAAKALGMALAVAT